MNKKLFVPEKKVIGATSPMPKAVTKAFPKIEESKNSIDPSTFGKPILERLPQPTGWRILVIIRTLINSHLVRGVMRKIGFLWEDMLEIGLKWKD